MNKPSGRRTEITIETRSLTIIRTRRTKPNFVRCRNCRTRTATFTRTETAAIFKVDVSEIERLFQTNQIHFADDAALCGNSLAAYFKKEIRYIED